MAGLCLITSLRREEAGNEEDQQVSGPAVVATKSFYSFCLDSHPQLPCPFSI